MKSHNGNPSSKNIAGDREHEADVDPEDLGDAAHHENHVADKAANRQEAGDQPGPEQQRTQEQAPDSERCLADG